MLLFCERTQRGEDKEVHAMTLFPIVDVESILTYEYIYGPSIQRRRSESSIFSSSRRRQFTHLL